MAKTDSLQGSLDLLVLKILSRRPKLIFINVDRGVALGEKSFEAGGGWKLGDKELLEMLHGRTDYRLVLDAPTSVAVYERIGK